MKDYCEVCGDPLIDHPDDFPCPATKADIIDEYLRTFSEAGLYPEFVAAVQALRRKPDVEGLSIKILNAICDTETADGHLWAWEMEVAIQNTLKAELT